MKTYETNGWYKFAEQDDWEHGCDPDTAFSYAGDEVFKAETVEDLLKQIRDFVGVGEAYELDIEPCETDGRVDIQILENKDAYAATDSEIEAWKRGEIKLWSAIYSFEIQEVERIQGLRRVQLLQVKQ